MGVRVLPGTPRLHMKQKKIISRFDAVLFDLDGVVINSEDISHDVLVEIARNYNSTFSLDDHMSIIGTTESYWSSYLKKKWNTDASADNIADTFWKNFKKSKLENARLMSGYEELIKFLKTKGTLIGLVSNSPKNQVFSLLKQLGIFEDFSVIITSNDFKNGKPDPEPYILAMENINVDPNKTIVIEDSEVGAESGKKAGCFVVGIPTKHSKVGTLENAQVNIRSLFELLLLMLD